MLTGKDLIADARRVTAKAREVHSFIMSISGFAVRNPDIANSMTSHSAGVRIVNDLIGAARDAETRARLSALPQRKPRLISRGLNRRRPRP